MDSREFENMLRRVMKCDIAAGTETFRDELLERCLAELGSDPHAADDVARVVEIDEVDLEMIAAAGNAMTQNGAPLGDNSLLRD